MLFRSAIKYHPRFPGQVYDAETANVYNLNRTYDPDNGRYTTSDPIGLNGGINTYAYVGAAPLTLIDPEGLQVFPLNPAAGAPLAGSNSTSATAAANYNIARGLGRFFDNAFTLPRTPGEWFCEANPITCMAFPGASQAIDNACLSTGADSADKPKTDGAKDAPKGKEKDVPNRGEPGEVKEGQRRTREYGPDRKSTRLNSSHIPLSRMPSSA